MGIKLQQKFVVLKLYWQIYVSLMITSQIFVIHFLMPNMECDNYLASHLTLRQGQEETTVWQRGCFPLLIFVFGVSG